MPLVKTESLHWRWLEQFAGPEWKWGADIAPVLDAARKRMTSKAFSVFEPWMRQQTYAAKVGREQAQAEAKRRHPQESCGHEATLQAADALVEDVAEDGNAWRERTSLIEAYRECRSKVTA